MISKIAMRHFDAYWIIIDHYWDQFGGVIYKIEPYREYFPVNFADNLTAEKAEQRLFQKMMEWAEIEKQELNHEDLIYSGIPGEFEAVMPSSLDERRVRSYWIFIYSFTNLLCRVMYGLTIEELVFAANCYRHQKDAPLCQYK